MSECCRSDGSGGSSSGQERQLDARDSCGRSRQYYRFADQGQHRAVFQLTIYFHSLLDIDYLQRAYLSPTGQFLQMALRVPKTLVQAVVPERLQAT